MEMVYLLLLVSVFLAAEPFAIKRSCFLPPAGGGKFITAIFCKLSLFMVSQRAPLPGPPFAPLVVHGKHFSLLFAPEQTWREINPSLFLSVCLHLTNHGFKCEFRNFFFPLRLFRFSRICCTAVAAMLKRHEHLSAVFTDGFRMISAEESSVEFGLFDGKLCACLQIALGCS